MSGERRLLVDDEEHLRSMLDAALRHSGFDVHPVENGRAALATVAEIGPDLIVLDVMLPDLDGFAVRQRLRSEGNRTPVLFLTARDGTEDKVRGLTLDDDGVRPIKEMTETAKAIGEGDLSRRIPESAPRRASWGRR